MADIYGSHFEYAGISSRTYGLIIANVETKRNTKLIGNIEGVNIFQKSDKKLYLIDDDFSNYPLSFDIEFVTDGDEYIDRSNKRAIEKWLFNRSSYCKLYMDETDDIYNETTEIISGVKKRLYLNCRFVNPEVLEYNGGIAGYKATLEADSGLWWQDPVCYVTDNLSSTPSSHLFVSVTMDTDIYDYTYPKVTILTGSSGGDIELINFSDDYTRITSFSEVPSGAYIEIKGGVNYVNWGFFQKMTNRNFPRMTDGLNTFFVQGDVKRIEFEFQNRRTF